MDVLKEICYGMCEGVVIFWSVKEVVESLMLCLVV